MTWPLALAASVQALGAQPIPHPGFLVGDPQLVDNAESILFRVGDGNQAIGALYTVRLHLHLEADVVEITAAFQCQEGLVVGGRRWSPVDGGS